MKITNSIKWFDSLVEIKEYIIVNNTQIVYGYERFGSEWEDFKKLVGELK